MRAHPFLCTRLVVLLFLGDIRVNLSEFYVKYSDFGLQLCEKMNYNLLTHFLAILYRFLNFSIFTVQFNF